MGTGLALGASFVDFRLWLLPWVAVAPIIAIAERSTSRRAFVLGWIAGCAGIALAFSWLIYAFRVFGGFSTPVALAIFTVPVLWMALQLGCFAAFVAAVRPLPLRLGPPIAFTAIEFVFPSLFPWRLAHTQYRVPILLQTGDVAGPSLLTFVIVWTGACLPAIAGSIRHRSGERHERRHATAASLAAAVTIVGILLYGWWRLETTRTARAGAPALRAGIVQGNIGVERKGNRSFFARNLDEYRRLSREIASSVDVLIWPETVVQQHVPIGLAQLPPSLNPFPEAPRPLLFGGLGVASNSTGRRRLFNSAFLIREDGHVLGRYDKRVLVPFGEYMPLGDRFPRLRALSPATSNFTAGEEPVVLPASTAARVAPLICYEDVIPGPAREAVRHGATLLVNLTNDAWYGDSAEPIQHEALAIWRAVETRRDLLRATNTGVTSAIAATGEVTAQLPLFEPATLTVEARLLSVSTLYTSIGDVFAWTVVVVAAVALAASLARQRSSTPPGRTASNAGRRRRR